MSEENLVEQGISSDGVPEHRLASITVRGLKVDEIIFTHGFPRYCDIDKCGGGCCHSGVYVDTDEYLQILGHKNEIIRVMDDSQVWDPGSWFDNNWIEDTDFVSGRAVGTQVRERDGGISGFTKGCVFLDRRHFCSIQVAATERGLHRWAWKPIYCVLFPITVVNGVLTYDDSHSAELRYCGPLGTGNYIHSVYEAMREEVQYFLGDEEFRKLDNYYQKNRNRFEVERAKHSLIQIQVKPHRSSKRSVT